MFAQKGLCEHCRIEIGINMDVDIASAPSALAFAMLPEMLGCHEGLQMLLHGIAVCPGNLNHLADR